MVAEISNVRHSSESVEHFTPGPIVEAARETMGSIDLDPATCELANRHIRASRIMTEEMNGYKRSWFGNVFLNPPGGQSDELEQRVLPKCTETGKCGLPIGHVHVGAQSSQKKWWFKLMREFLKGNVESAIFISFSIELLQTTQSNTPALPSIFGPLAPIPLDFPICFPRARVDYLKEQADGSLRKGGAPPHASAIVCISYQRSVREEFARRFRQFGRVKL